MAKKAVAFWGQSNLEGMCLASAVGLSAPFPAFPFRRRHSLAAGTVWVTDGLVPVAPRVNAVGGPFAAGTGGLEMSLGRRLVALAPEHEWFGFSMATDGAGLEDEILSSSFPAGGPPWLTQFRSSLSSFLAETGAELAVIGSVHGEADMLRSPDASNYYSNLGVIEDALRADHGPDYGTILHRLSSKSGGSNSSSVIREAQERFAAGRPKVRLTYGDHLGMRDLYHYDDLGLVDLGELFAEQIVDHVRSTPRPNPRWSAAAVPVVASSTSGATVPMPAYEPGDLLVLVYGGIGTAAPATPAGWTPVGASPQAGGGTAQRLHAWTRVVGAGETVAAADFADPGADDSKIMGCFAIKGVLTTAPIVASYGSVQATDSTTANMPGGSATAGDLIVGILAHNIDSNAAQYACSDSTYVEHVDYSSTTGSGAGFAVVVGYAVGGAFGPIPGTLATAGTSAAITLVVAPAPPPPPSSTARPPWLQDDVPGHLGLEVEAARESPLVFLALQERAGLPVDSAKTLAVLSPPSSYDAPVIAQAWTGRGRVYSQSTPAPLEAADQDGRSSLESHDVTIQALVAFDRSSATGPATLFARGTDGSASEYYAYGLELVPAAAPGEIDVRMFWQTTAGSVVVTAPGTYVDPGPGRTVLITASRRWDGPDSVTCRYYVGPVLLAEVTSTQGLIGGGVSGRSSLGARRTAGAWGRGWSGTIDQVLVLGRAITAPEVEATWRRLAVHQPAGVVRWRALQPPGVSWSPSDASRLGALRRVFGEMMGTAAAAAEHMQDLLPDRCPADVLERWEATLRLIPGPIDSVDGRRGRVIPRLVEEEGYDRPAISRLLAPLLGLSVEAVRAAILEYRNTVTDTFSATEWAPMWQRNAAGATFTPGSSGGLRVQAAIGAAPLLSAPRFLPSVRTSILPGRRGPAANGAGMSAQLRLASVAAWPSTTALLALLTWWEPLQPGGILMVGIDKPAADYRLVWRTIVGGVASAPTVLATLGASPIVYLRVTRTATPTQYVVGWSATSFAAIASTVTITGPSNPTRVGLSLCDVAALPAALDCIVDDFTLRAPAAKLVFHAYVLATDGDISGANSILREVSPAHVHARVIRNVRTLAGDPTTPCGHGPL